MVQLDARAAVFGAHGFVGRHLISYLSANGYAVRAIARGDQSWRGEHLGHVFYTIGLTADFRSRPFETIDAHVGVLTDVLRGARFTSFVYCSSTRVYSSMETSLETARIPVAPEDPDHLYNISKLMGESACLASGLAGARVARLSNVFGEDLASANFLTAVLREAVETGRVTLRTSLASEKDYVWVEDVVRALEAIAVRGAEPITNVAFGRNTTHAEIMAAVTAATGADVHVAEGAPAVRVPPISTARLDNLIGRDRADVILSIDKLAAAFRGR
ncbi:MAG: SDR family oxidoreductase [Hyphomicrobium sp.]|jgi:nucleoside-diphosphate-sugar epimerase